MLSIRNPQFVNCYVDLRKLPAEDKPEIALAGRSNVGKSSLINCICKRRKLAKSSSTPGKTRTINFYDMDGSWYFVDLPGYGYAKVSKEEQARWGKIIERYLKNRQQLKGVIFLIDIRHEPGANDRQMKDWLSRCELPVLVVATKADKLSRAQTIKQLAVIKKSLDLPFDPIPFSAETGQGEKEVAEALEEILQMETVPRNTGEA